MSKFVIDPQVNGGFIQYPDGRTSIVDFSDPNLKSEDVIFLADKYLNEYQTFLIPTIITADHQVMLRNTDLITDAIGNHPIFLGLHLEGPHLSKISKGAHPEDKILPPDIKKFKELFKSAKEKMALTTVAPETENALNYIKEVSELGITVSLGHFATNLETIKKAFQAGATAMTHAGNTWKFPDFNHKSTDVYNILREENIFIMVIPDARHVHLDFVRMCFEITKFIKKDFEKFIITADTSPLQGAPNGEYKVFENLNVVIQDDDLNNFKKSIPLSGSWLNLRECMAVLSKANFMTATEINSSANQNTVKMLETPLKRLKYLNKISSLG